jgi:hypothetical protein
VGTKSTHVAWGHQPAPFANTLAWVLPNPSGRNRNFSLTDLVDAYAELRRALPDSEGKRKARQSEDVARERRMQLAAVLELDDGAWARAGQERLQRWREY